MGFSVEADGRGEEGVRHLRWEQVRAAGHFMRQVGRSFPPPVPPKPGLQRRFLFPFFRIKISPAVCSRFEAQFSQAQAHLSSVPWEPNEKYPRPRGPCHRSPQTDQWSSTTFPKHHPLPHAAQAASPSQPASGYLKSNCLGLKKGPNVSIT